MSENFTLTAQERHDLESFRDHCKHTIEYIDDLLNNEKIDDDCSEIDWIYADNARGIILDADWNIVKNHSFVSHTMHLQIRTIQDLYKRYQEWKEARSGME